MTLSPPPPSLSQVKAKLDAFVATCSALGGFEYAFFALAWVVAKVLCLDPLTFLLALSSGVLFGGVGQGALVSAACATLGSSCAFALSREFASERVARVTARVATLRAVNRAVASEAFKTVLVLRLAPILPIPIGAYNYV